MAEKQKPQTNAGASDVDIGIIAQIFKSQNKIKGVCIEFPLYAGLAFGTWAAGLKIMHEPAP